MAHVFKLLGAQVQAFLFRFLAVVFFYHSLHFGADRRRQVSDKRGSGGPNEILRERVPPFREAQGDDDLVLTAFDVCDQTKVHDVPVLHRRMAHFLERLDYSFAFNHFTIFISLSR